MKLLLLLGLLLGITAKAQIVNIPDPEFKAKLLAYGPGLDTNGDGEIQVTEAENFAYPLSVQGTISNPGTITDLTGIEAFVNITELYCRFNAITELDLTHNTKLTLIDVGHNNLTSLTISSCPLVVDLYCHYNQLVTLDVSNNVNITTLLCNNNQLSSLDLSNNTILEQVQCGYNQLGTIDINNNPELKVLGCSNNGLTELDLSAVPQLTNLLCEDNGLTSLDLSHNPLLETVGCGYNSLTDLDISNNPLLTGIYCYGNQLTTIDLTNTPELKSFYCGSNPITSLDVSTNTQLNTISCSQTNLTTLDLSNNPNLVVILCNTNYSLTYINLKNGNNENISTVFSNFGWLDALETVCLDDAQSALANFIVSEVGHPVNFIEECLPTASVATAVADTFTIYPNPVNDVLSINSGLPVGAIQIYSSLGQLVSSCTGSNTINLSHLGSGIYMVSVTDTNGGTDIQKIIKQ